MTKKLRLKNTKKDIKDSLDTHDEWMENMYNEGHFTGGNFPPYNVGKIHYLGVALLFASFICLIGSFLEEFNLWLFLMGISQFLIGVYLVYKRFSK